MHLRLITYKAEDGLELDGAYYAAGAAPQSSAPLIIMTHGAWMNFYTGPPRFLPTHLTAAGFDCLAINSRDHDLGGIHPSTGRCFGMLRCRFEDIVPDLAGALTWGREHGYDRFILACHSYSGQRAAFYLANRTDEGIEGLVMMSPPAGLPSVHQYWVDDWQRFEGQARQLVAVGKEDEIVVERAAGRFPIIASAGTILNLWLENRLEDTSFMAGLKTPLLITLGEKETGQEPPQRMVEGIASAWKGPVRKTVITGAGHYYLENQGELASVLLAWLQKLQRTQSES